MQNDIVLFAASSGLEYYVTLEGYFILLIIVKMLGTSYIVCVQVQYTGAVLTH